MTITAEQQAFNKSSRLLLQANRLHIKLCDLELKHEEDKLDVCQRLSTLIDRAYRRAIRRYIKTIDQANKITTALTV